MDLPGPPIPPPEPADPNPPGSFGLLLNVAAVIAFAVALFDVEGTLVDSNYMHVYAWQRAFHAENLAVQAWRIHRRIGMDGSLLLSTLTGDADDDARGRLEDLRFSLILLRLALTDQVLATGDRSDHLLRLTLGVFDAAHDAFFRAAVLLSHLHSVQRLHA